MSNWTEELSDEHKEQIWHFIVETVRNIILPFTLVAPETGSVKMKNAANMVAPENQ